jgi:serine/threonine protein kinase
MRSKSSAMNASVYCAQCGALNQPQAVTCFACGRPLDEPAPTATDARRLIGGRYRLVRQLGVGGFGAVYQAEDTTLGNRWVALKEVSPRGLNADEAREATDAFQREALLLAGLSHPSLPRIYERFEEEGRWYLVMDFIEGETLEVYLDKHGGKLPVKEALQIALHLTDVLSYLHSRQPPIIFRDLKPSNIIRAPDGHMTLVDFGIARFFKPGQTKDTIAFGSPGYAAPEQYGKAQTTPRSDIFSLGVVLHQMLTGVDPADKPFHFAPLTMPRPAGLSGLIGLMVKIDESKRPRSMEVIKRELTVLLDVQTTSWRDDDLVAARASLSPVLAQRIAQLSNVQGAQPASHNASFAQPRVSLLAAWKQQTTLGKTAGWAILGMILLFVVPALIYLGTYHSSQQNYTYTDTNSGYSSTPIIQPTDTAIPAGSGVPTQPATPTPPGTTSSPGVAVYSVAWSPDGTRVASGGADGTIAIADATTGALLKLDTTFYKVNTLAWSPNGRYLATAGDTSILQIWDAGGPLYRTYQIAANNSISLSWSPDNEHLVLGSVGGSIQIVDAFSGASTILAQNGNYLAAVAWSPDGEYIAAGGAAQPVEIWQSATHQVVYTDQNHQGTITAFAWSPDGKRIVSAGYDANGSVSYIEDWDALTGAHTVPYGEDTYGVNALAWSPNGKRIASGDDNGTIQIWYQGSGSTFSIVSNRAQAVHALAWSPDGNSIASASQDGTVQIWDAFTGDNLFTYQQP